MKTKRQYILRHKIYYEQGNCGKLLAKAVQNKKVASTIHQIRDKQGTPHSSNEENAKQFENYYQSLYNIPSNPRCPHNTDKRTKLIQDFLEKYSPPKIAENIAQELEAPISGPEFDKSIKDMKTGKDPGPDGLPLQYYKTFTNILKPRFLKTFQSLHTEQQPPKELLEAHITVIPKEGKDTNLVANYRPISLINVDVKIYAKILANRLLPLLTSLISLDQVGFIPGREGRDNTIKALNINHWLTSNKKQGFFLSLDAEKVFDRVAWDFIDAVLKHIGILPLMRSYIRALYSNPTARVCVNGHLSNAFHLQNGTRQGCTLSPLLFVLRLEPILNKIRLNSDIKGIEIQNHTYKVAAFADDMLLFLSEPHISIPNLVQDLEYYQLLSNLKINHSKSNTLNISIPPSSVEICQKTSPSHGPDTVLHTSELKSLQI